MLKTRCQGDGDGEIVRGGHFLLVRLLWSHRRLYELTLATPLRGWRRQRVNRGGGQQSPAALVGRAGSAARGAVNGSQRAGSGGLLRAPGCAAQHLWRLSLVGHGAMKLFCVWLLLPVLCYGGLYPLPREERPAARGWNVNPEPEYLFLVKPDCSCNLYNITPFKRNRRGRNLPFPSSPL